MEIIDNYIEINQVKTRYITMGKGGYDIVLLHSLTASLEYWQFNLASLSNFGKVYALDLVGFGKTDKPKENYSIDYYASFVLDFIKKLNLSNIILVGHCLGGGIALQSAFIENEKIKKLILIGSPCFSKKINLYLRLLTIPFLGEILSIPLGKIFSDRILNMNIFHKNSLPADFYQLNHENIMMSDSQRVILSTIRESMNFSGVKPSLLNRLNAIVELSIPMLIIWGQEDKIVPVLQAKVAKEKYPTAELHILKNCGHMPHVEYPDKVNELVANFINN